MKFSEASKSEKRALRILAQYRPQKRITYVMIALATVIQFAVLAFDLVLYARTGSVACLFMAAAALVTVAVVIYLCRYMWAGVIDRYKDNRERRRENAESN